MRIYLIGQKWLLRSVDCMVRSRGHEVVGVCAPPGDKLHDSDQWPLAAGHLPDCDLIIAAHAHMYIPLAVLARATHGCLAYHPSLLPRHKGRDAIEWAVRFNDPITGGTVYWMDDAVDGGTIAAQEWCFVLPGDDAATLWRRSLGPIGVKLFEIVLEALERGERLEVETVSEVATWEPAILKGALRAS